MRLLAILRTVVMLGATAWAAQALWAELSTPPSAAALQDRADGAAEPQPPAPPSRQLWPALFGEPQPPTPPAPPPKAEEKQPPSAPKPPLASLGYVLNGLVRTDTGTWAMLSHPTGGHLLRTGDEVVPGMTVARIDDSGLWVSRDGDTPELLAFPE